MHLWSTIVLSLCVGALTARADVADPQSDPVPPLRDHVEALDAVGVDVLFSHDSEAGRDGPSFGDRPRLAPLVGFKAWSRAAADVDRYQTWLDAFETGARGALAAAPTEGADKRPDLDAFTRIWKDADEGRRIVVTFDEDDLETAEQIAGVLEQHGYAVYLAVADPPGEPIEPELLGRLFVEADHCLVVDTASARLNGVVHFEAELLAELRRQRAWVASGKDELPPVKRESMDVIEALGVLPMQVLPGGIVLGMPPVLESALAGGTLAVNGSDYGLEADGTRFVLAQVSVETREAIDAFVAIEDSDSVVDIAGGRVTLTRPFKETRIGKRMARADRRPFKRLSVRGAQKSLIVDDGIRLRRDGDGVAADVALEVRFYRRDEEGHADRLATLRFTVEDATGAATLGQLAWSVPSGSDAGLDREAAEKLVKDLHQCALDAALIAIARLGPA
jgi:hypothetical protein